MARRKARWLVASFTPVRAGTPPAGWDPDIEHESDCNQTGSACLDGSPRLRLPTGKPDVDGLTRWSVRSLKSERVGWESSEAFADAHTASRGSARASGSRTWARAICGTGRGLVASLRSPPPLGWVRAPQAPGGRCALPGGWIDCAARVDSRRQGSLRSVPMATPHRRPRFARPGVPLATAP